MKIETSRLRPGEAREPAKKPRKGSSRDERVSFEELLRRRSGERAATGQGGREGDAGALAAAPERGAVEEGVLDARDGRAQELEVRRERSLFEHELEQARGDEHIEHREQLGEEVIDERRDDDEGAAGARSSAGDLERLSPDLAGGVVDSPERAERAPAAPSTAAALAERILEACFVGQDEHSRRVMMLDLTIPGRGRVRVRLTRRGERVDVRIRAEQGQTRGLIERGLGELRASGAERGVRFGQIQLV